MSTDHDLTLTPEPNARYGGPREHLPQLTAACGCGGWSEYVQRFDAIDNPRYEAVLREWHRIHALLDVADPRWPARGSGLHPLLAPGQYDDSARTTGEYATRYVPSTGGYGRTGGAHAIALAIIAELQAAGADIGDGKAVDLAQAVHVAAAAALVQRLKDAMPEVMAWRVWVTDGPNASASMSRRGWVFTGHHDQEHAELYAPVVANHLNRGHRGDGFEYYATVVNYGPVPISKLVLRGTDPLLDYLLTPARG